MLKPFYGAIEIWPGGIHDLRQFQGSPWGSSKNA